MDFSEVMALSYDGSELLPTQLGGQKQQGGNLVSA